MCAEGGMGRSTLSYDAGLDPTSQSFLWLKWRRQAPALFEPLPGGAQRTQQQNDDRLAVSLPLALMHMLPLKHECPAPLRPRCPRVPGRMLGGAPLCLH